MSLPRINEFVSPYHVPAYESEDRERLDRLLGEILTCRNTLKQFRDGDREIQQRFQIPDQIWRDLMMWRKLSLEDLCQQILAKSV